MPSHEPDIIIFDGDCNFCNKYINYIIAHDHTNRFVFAASTSTAAQVLLVQNNVDLKYLDSIILISGDRVNSRSDAVLGIIKHLNCGIWMLGIFSIVPKSIRDFFYIQFAKRRYVLFGQNNNCVIPTPEIKAKFLI